MCLRLASDALWYTGNDANDNSLEGESWKDILRIGKPTQRPPEGFFDLHSKIYQQVWNSEIFLDDNE